MLRDRGFLPSQLRAAWELARTRELEEGEFVRMFGRSREFLPGAPYHTPLVNNIVASTTYRDQYGRQYSCADPSDYEYAPESGSVPEISFTDRLYVCIANATKHRLHAGDDTTMVIENITLPTVDDVLQLVQTGSTFITARVTAVHEIRIASGCIEIDGYVRTGIRNAFSVMQDSFAHTY